MSHKISVACATFVISSASIAEQTGAQTGDKGVTTVEVKGSAEMQRQNDTASRIVVTHEELVKFGDRSVLDAMKRLPGVTVSDSGVRMRGLGNGYTQVLVNGERTPAGFSLETLAPDAIEKIEIIRAATAEYSTQSIAGTLNVILRKSVKRNSSEIKLSEGGSHGGKSPGLHLGFSGKNDSYSYTLGANLSHNDLTSSLTGVDSAYAPTGELTELRTTNTQNHNLATNGSFNSRVNWALGNGDSLTWQTFGSGGQFHGSADNGTTTIAGPDYPYPDLRVRFDGHSASVRSDLNLVKRFEGGAKLDTKAGLYSSQTDRDMHRWGMHGGDLMLDRDYDSSIHDKGGTTTGKYSVPLIPEHAFAFGWDAGRSVYRQQDVQVDQPLPSAEPFNFDNSFGATVSRLALYAQDEWDIRANWSVYLGARWEGLRTTTMGSGFAPTSSRYSIFSPLMQTLWKVPSTKGDQVRLALTRTYRAPPCFVSCSATSTRPSTPLYRPTSSATRRCARNLPPASMWPMNIT
jgi:outer membrane receptor for ferrienterochelin and colicins